MTMNPRNPRFGSLGIFSVGVIAFSLATLQGCAPASLTGGSSPAKEPGNVSMPPLGSLEADEAPRATHHHVTERAETHAAARPAESRSFRPEYCRRCSQ
jgi:hypothetical protein